MNTNQLLPSVRIEVEKPFEEKLQRAKQLVKLWANKDASVSCSFGKDSMVVLYLALQENKNIPVIFNNTGIEWPETLAFKEQIKLAWNLNLLELKPIMSYWQVWKRIKERNLGSQDGSKNGSDLCCDYLKEKPFRKAVKENNIRYAFTGVTASESRQRMWVACQRGQEYYSKKDGVWKVHPILYWTEKEVWQFIEENHIPLSPAYQKYAVNRLGCMFCVSYKGWRKQMARTNLKAYKFIQEQYFGQKLMSSYDSESIMLFNSEKSKHE
jgi:3'-phosphoadenosine 5'-phosphosulfate sulfotransferase (PAPS reductase)/FAD synthetase